MRACEFQAVTEHNSQDGRREFHTEAVSYDISVVLGDTSD